MSLYKSVLKPLLFSLDPESAHHFTFSIIKNLFKVPGVSAEVKAQFTVNNPKLEKTVFGIRFPNPVGLAAGLDKNAILFDELSCLGFGFVEIGTVTLLSQEGNPKPRMFRLPKDEALINRMGFNNDGAKAIAERLRKKKSNIIIGGNIGKNKVTPNENAINDYEICFKELYSVVDYFVVNVSSPNTPGLRELQEKEPLKRILNRLQELNEQLRISDSGFRIEGKRKPILLKIAPDLTNEQLDEIVEVVLETKLDGVIATNTTISRANLNTPSPELDSMGAGGLSGKPLSQKSTEVIRYIALKAQKRFAVIGSGGVHSPEDAVEKLNAGADLIQLYTGFVYEGPGLVKRILQRLLQS
jgi:dihydroorotate dehydrogenase